MEQSEVRIHSVIRNDQHELNQFLETLGDRLEETGVGFAVATRIQVCLDEMLSNAVKYGYPPEQAGQIDITIAFEGEDILVTVSDDGIGFNPFERESPNSLDQELEARDIGGLGIHIVKTMANRYDYQRTKNLNVNRFWLSAR